MRPGLLRAHSYFRAGISPTQASYKRDVFFARRTGSSFLNQEGSRTMNHKILELRAQGAQIDAAARATPPRRHLEAVPEKTSVAKSLGLVWVLTPSFSITMAGLKQVLKGKADVKIGGESPTGSPSCVVLYAAGGMEESCLDGRGRIRELYPEVPLLVLGSHLDLELACATLKKWRRWVRAHDD